MSATEQTQPSASRLPPNNLSPVRSVKISRAVKTVPISTNPMTVVERAIERGITGADLKEIMDLQERWEANEARKAFEIALAGAVAELPIIVRNRLVNFEGRNGGRTTNYRHEDMAEIVEAIRPILHKHGLAHRFRPAQNLESGLITVTCIISGHGHREETPLSSKADGNPSGMNDLQRIASATTYLQRYTLKMALGLAVAHDDDGRGAGAKVIEAAAQPGCITEAQADEIRRLLDERGITQRGFLQFIKLPRIEAIGLEHFDRAVEKIRNMGART